MKREGCGKAIHEIVRPQRDMHGPKRMSPHGPLRSSGKLAKDSTDRSCESLKDGGIDSKGDGDEVSAMESACCQKAFLKCLLALKMDASCSLLSPCSKWQKLHAEPLGQPPGVEWNQHGRH